MSQLPIDCKATYYASFLSTSESLALFTEIMAGYSINNRVIKMSDGSEHISETGQYMFTDKDLLSYEALPEVWGGRSVWPDSLASVRDRIRQATGVYFHVARCVYYQDGSEGVGFHSDLPAYGPTHSIASLSLGAERNFIFKNLEDPEDTFDLRLHNGSLLYMGENCQERYQHALPRCTQSKEPRINLTFRMYGND